MSTGRVVGVTRVVGFFYPPLVAAPLPKLEAPRRRKRRWWHWSWGDVFWVLVFTSPIWVAVLVAVGGAGEKTAGGVFTVLATVFYIVVPALFWLFDWFRDWSRRVGEWFARNSFQPTPGPTYETYSPPRWSPPSGCEAAGCGGSVSYRVNIADFLDRGEVGALLAVRNVPERVVAQMRDIILAPKNLCSKHADELAAILDSMPPKETPTVVRSVPTGPRPSPPRRVKRKPARRKR